MSASTNRLLAKNPLCLADGSEFRYKSFCTNDLKSRVSLESLKLLRLPITLVTAGLNKYHHGRFLTNTKVLAQSLEGIRNSYDGTQLTVNYVPNSSNSAVQDKYSPYTATDFRGNLKTQLKASHLSSPGVTYIHLECKGKVQHSTMIAVVSRDDQLTNKRKHQLVFLILKEHLRSSQN